MAYVELADVKKVLKDSLFDYPGSIASEFEFAEAYINGRLAGHYPLPFDDTDIYASVPTQIKWIAAHLVGYKLWDGAVALEGQTSDTAAKRWKKLADEWLTRLVKLEELLVLDDGTIISITNDTLRFYPSGVRDKADNDKNVPMFKRADAHQW
ncbi:hypothetical protein LCGC14_0901600 [marine sediment metagenome]|uniref:DUF1320 domain-containing protein n=1 Tax=marine sediment metagenome TaxID=412755 RepID=A0A0F9S384_9ZZZZ